MKKRKTFPLPFPWFGGKTLASHIIWERFGHVNNYVEPFFGGGAVLFNRPRPVGYETVNDKDCYVSNFWRATKHDPQGVAQWAQWPVNEADLTARHHWLKKQIGFIDKMMRDPDYYDSKIAGWWVWGLCLWIGGQWCSVNWKSRPCLGAGNGILRRKLLQLHRSQGIISDAQRFEKQSYFEAIASRLKDVRVCCGDWKRVLGPSVTTKLVKRTAVLLDPPYLDTQRDSQIYSVEGRLGDGGHVAIEAMHWAIENGDNPGLRIALCGYEGDYEMPDSWFCVAWRRGPGMSNLSANGKKEMRDLERIWFSPHCLKPLELFS